ncbi:MAG: quinol:electron acceptor oxidoreductase subunit ActD [Bacteroidota bacterium]
MNEKILYGYTGLFDTPDEIIEAAEKVSAEGFEKYDVHTPYPVHGMDSAMKLKPSKLPYIALVIGLSAMVTMFIFMYWMTSIDYPVIVGGKPFFSFPAWVPVLFEITVLSASIGTVVAMIAVFFKFPNLSHPLHDTDFMKSVSSDKYGISIEAVDSRFNEDYVRSFLSSIGAKEISPVYWDDEEVTFKNTVLKPKFLTFLIVVGLAVSGTTYFTLNKLMFMVPFNWMREQEKYIPQEISTFFEDGFSMRTPVKGSVALGNIPYRFSGDPEGAGEALVNPLAVTKENLELGKEKFDIYCSPCHGYFGEGDSRLKGQFPNPPSFHSEKVRNWSDGRIYAVLMDGQNVMPSYSSQLDRAERWAVILYMRALQRSLNAKESDLK